METLIRGTTPTITFKYKEVNVESITSAILVIKQLEEVVIEKPLNAAVVSVEDQTISWVLTQQESLSLMPDVPALICCDWKVVEVRGRSKKLICDVDDPGKDEVI